MTHREAASSECSHVRLLCRSFILQPPRVNLQKYNDFLKVIIVSNKEASNSASFISYANIFNYNQCTCM